MNWMPYVIMLRPRQWIKNLMIFFPPFLSGALISSSCLSVVSLISLLSFCSVSSALYIYNDLTDIEKDAMHPVKCLRPIASGKVSATAASAIAITSGLTGIVAAFYFAHSLIPYLLLYAVVTVAYSKWLKNRPVLDLFCISSGFLIRLQAGGALFQVAISEWLFLSVFFLSLCLSCGKRLSEQNLLGEHASDHRSSLSGYPEGALDAMLLVSAATVLVTYSMYTLIHPPLVYSVPLCAFGLFRYIIRIRAGKNGDPTESLFKDVSLLCVSVLWVLIVGWSIYL